MVSRVRVANNTGDPAERLPNCESARTHYFAPPSSNIDNPDGRISGIVRDAKSGQPVADATVELQTNIDDREEHVKLTTGPEGRGALPFRRDQAWQPRRADRCAAVSRAGADQLPS